MKYFVLILCFIFSKVVLAQIQFQEVTSSPFEGVDFSSIAFADIDGDNDQDVLITGRNASIQRISKLYTNDGSGNFTEVTSTPFEGVNFSSIAFADIDGDNDQDVLITGQNDSFQSISKLYTNDGGGSFTEIEDTPFDGADNSSIAFADIDGDNDQDVLITGRNASSQRISKLYTNDGSGSFTEVAGTPFEGIQSGSIAFADIDGDNDQDVLITGENSSMQRISKLYTNNATGNFTEVEDTPFDGIRSSFIAFADVDGDNDQDVLITGSISSSQRISKLYSNDGSGSFTEVSTPFEGVQGGSIAFADVDGDNDQDVLITGLKPNNQRISKLYSNSGDGSFTEVLGTPFDGVVAGSIAFSDIDGDNDQDVLITGLGNSQFISKLYLNTTTLSTVDSNFGSNFSLYPNPTNAGEFNIKTPNLSGEVIIGIINLLGQQVFSQKLDADGSQVNVSTENLSKGVYVVKLSQNNQSFSSKLIVE